MRPTDTSAAEAKRAATLKRQGKFVVADFLFGDQYQVAVDSNWRKVAALGDLVTVSAGPRRAKVIDCIGSAESVHDVLSALLIEKDFTVEFDPALETAAGQVADTALRRNLTDEVTFTIDPGQARDHDDAISVNRDGEHFTLNVHIADVSALVEASSPIDSEAYQRGLSAYLPDRVVPMLPQRLSSDLCSLSPGDARPAVTVAMHLDSGGRVVKVEFFRSLIRSDAKLTYDGVDGFLNGKGLDAPEPVRESLLLARELSRCLRRRRYGRGALVIETHEPEFLFDSSERLCGADAVKPTPAHNLIEEFMILANEQVAHFLEKRHSPLLYRVHDQPPPQSLLILIDQLESLGVPTPPIPDYLPPGESGQFAAAISAKVEKHLTKNAGKGRQALTSLTLRAMQRALYSPYNSGHAGLASTSYCHFTSPIRRYPDLIVHRALTCQLGHSDSRPGASDMAEAGEHCSARERAALELERNGAKICLSYLLCEQLNEHGWNQAYDGEIVGLVGGGAFVRFGLYEGFLPARELRGDYFVLNDLQTMLTGRRTKATLRLGDAVEVKVSRVDWIRGRVDLELAKSHS